MYIFYKVLMLIFTYVHISKTQPWPQDQGIFAEFPPGLFDSSDQVKLSEPSQNYGNLNSFRQGFQPVGIPQSAQFPQPGPIGQNAQSGPNGFSGPSGPIFQTNYQNQGQNIPGLATGPQGLTSVDDIMKFVHQKYQDLFPTAGTYPSATTIPLPSLPDLSPISQKCPKNGFFYSFSPMHMDAIRDVKQILLGANSTGEMLDIAKALQQSPDIHSHLWFYAFSSLVVKDPLLQRVHRVSPVEVLPDIFINSETLRRARGGTTRARRQGQTCTVLDETIGSDNGAENLLWYFRESVPVNAHHWYYHTMYPFSAARQEDRHGELFYYMHSSIVARYNAERLSNGLARIQPITPLQRGTPIDGYNPHLQDDSSGLQWTPRSANLPLSDVIHQNDPNIGSNILLNSQILGARDRILQAINSGFVINSNNQRVSIQNRQGIDILGNIIQSNQWSLNLNYYGSNSPSGLHNNGHLVFALQSDPLYRQRLPPGVMADSAPAMRDVLFYRWHAFMNQIFEAHKRTLAPYTPIGGELPLLWSAVSVTSFAVTTSSGSNPNRIRTFWGQQPMTLNRGIDFTQYQNGRTIQICAKQLDQEPFNYQISINNQNSVANRASFRIFMAPRFDEAGNRLSMSDQRTMFFVLDTFGLNLNPGMNTITRRSIDSTLTIPWSQSIQEINGDPGQTTPYCGCGWPRNMLIPKGTPSGMTFDLFIMVTNGADDAVQQTSFQQPTCISAPLYCGIAGQLYPDSKPMGYPFDRLPYSNNQGIVGNLDEYVSGISNMATAQIVIQFTGQ